VCRICDTGCVGDVGALDAWELAHSPLLRVLRWSRLASRHWTLPVADERAWGHEKAQAPYHAWVRSVSASPQPTPSPRPIPPPVRAPIPR
jgi:hypothetical protein